MKCESIKKREHVLSFFICAIIIEKRAVGDTEHERAYS